MNLGIECKDCLCSTCANLDGCTTMCGDTEAYCNEDCRGEDGPMRICSEYEKEVV